MNLDDLQNEVEKLLALLKDRQQGLMSWNVFLAERLEKVQKLIASAGITASSPSDGAAHDVLVQVADAGTELNYGAGGVWVPKEVWNKVLKQVEKNF